MKLRPIRLPPIQSFALGNGLGVKLVRHPRVPMATMRLLIRAGSDADPQGREGLADLTAQLLRRGTRKRSARALDEAVERIGGSLAIGCGADWLAMRISAPGVYLDGLLGLMAELIRSPRWDAGEFRSTRGRALAELASDRDDPDWVADRAIARQVWGAHPYGQVGSGTLASVERIKRSDVIRYHEEHLGPRVALLTVVGDLKIARAAAAVRRAFGGWRGGPGEPARVRQAPSSPGAGKVLWIHRRDLTQSQIRIGWQSELPPDARAMPGILVNHVLGGSFISRLVVAARVRRGLTYGIDSQLNWRVHGTSHEVSTSTETGHTRQMIDVILGEVSGLKRSGPRAAELSSAQQAIVGLYPASLERNESIASKLGDVWMFGLPADWIEQYRERVAAVSRAQAVGAARELLSPHAPAIVVVGNASRAARQLHTLGPVKVVPLAKYA